MTRVIVLQGGWSAERDVSLSTAKNICDALQRQNYDVVLLDPSPDFLTLANQLKNAKGDVVFNALHGTGGEDGIMQAVLDLAKIPYTHSGVAASAASFNKKMTKAIVSAVDVPVTQDKIMTRADLRQGHPMPVPYVVKPIADGSSVGVTIVNNDADLAKTLQNADDTQIVMIEKFIAGEELTVGVSDLFNADQQPAALCITMLKSNNDFYDYTAKYTDGVTTHIINPDLPADVTEKLKDYAVRAHQALGCDMISRSDFRYNPTDGIIFLETNTQPGMTPLSLYPEQVQAAGYSFDILVKALVEKALQCAKKPVDNGSHRTKAA